MTALKNDRLLRALATRWKATPPSHPVIAAGTTGSIPATADLLAVIQTLPAGHVVLPGLDTDMAQSAWDRIEPSHPQFGLHALLNHLERAREDVVLWPGADASGFARHARW